MEKICIVKRRKVTCGQPEEVRAVNDQTSRSQVLSIELTPQQTKAIQSNSLFQHLYGADVSQISLNLYFSNPLPPKMLKPKQVGEMLQVSKHTITRLTKTGVIKSYKIGRLRRFSVEDVLDYLSSQCEGRETEIAPRRSCRAGKAV
jgi:excisionase family DNA binding protein